MEGDTFKAPTTVQYSSSPSTYMNESKKSEGPPHDVITELSKKKRHNSHHSVHSNDSDCVHDHMLHQSPFSFRGRYFDSPNRDINVASPWFLCNRPQPGGFNCAIHADGPPSFVPGVVNQINNKPFAMPQQLFPEEGASYPPAHFIYHPPYSFPPPTMPWPPRPTQHYPYPQPPRFNNIYTTQPIPVPGGMTTFQPIRTRCFTPMPRNLSPPSNLAAFSVPNAVELVVSNLDYNISAKEWRKILFTTFHPQVQVLNIFVKTQPDNTSIAMVKVPSIEDARFAISQFHRKKIGYKRIHVTLKNEESQYLTTSTRTEVVALLSEVHGGVLPLFKFIELFDKRYHRPISVSELYKMKDIIEISEQGGAGRMIYLRGQCSSSSETSPEAPSIETPEASEVLEIPVCQKHCENTSTLNYIVALNCSMLPTVFIDLATLGAQVHSLLQDHDGSMHLMSFTACYETKFAALETMESGVPLEHLISCIPGVEVHVTKTGVKKIQWTENKPLDSPGSTSSQGSNSPLLSQQLSQICRETVDLLKHSPNCRMPFSKFIPAYHHHFGRQCRVADYGYTRLYELFEAIPHILQVMGVGDRRILTLTHKAQVRRFTSDLLRVLKTYPSKEMPLSALYDAFEKIHEKTLEITDYGVCSLDDLMDHVTSHSLTVSIEDGETILSIPKKDQSVEESGRTKQFGLEVIDLLKHNPQCHMPFNKFIPAYHHHFGRQCRVSDYGFTKLTELFDCLPNIVKQLDDGDERIIALTKPELLKVMSEQIIRLLQTHPKQRVPLSDFHQNFSSHYGFTILLDDFGVDSIPQLLALFKHVIKIEPINGSPYVILIHRESMPLLAHQILLVLMNQSGGSLPLVELCSRYRSTFEAECDVQRVREELIDFVQISGDDQSGIISLTHLQSFARDIRNLLLGHSCQLPYHRLEYEYLQKFGVEIKPSLYGYSSITALLGSIPHIVTVNGTGIKRMLQLCLEFQNNSMTAAPMSPLIYQHDHNFNDMPNFNDTSYTSTHDPYTSLPHSKSDSGFVSSRDSSRHNNTLSPPSDVLTRQAQDVNKLPSPKEIFWTRESSYSATGKSSSSVPTSELLHLAAQCLPDQSDLSVPKSRLTAPLTVKTGQESDSENRAPKTDHNANNVKPTGDEFMTKFTGGWWKVSTEQLHSMPIVRNHMDRIKLGNDSKIPDNPNKMPLYNVPEHRIILDHTAPTQNYDFSAKNFTGKMDFSGKFTANKKSGNLRGVYGEKYDSQPSYNSMFAMESDFDGHRSDFHTNIGTRPLFTERVGDFVSNRSDYDKALHDNQNDFKENTPVYKPTVFRDIDEDKCRLPQHGDSRDASPNAKTGIFGSPGLCHITKLLDFDVNEIKLDRSYEMRSKLRKPTRSDCSILGTMALEGTSANNSFMDDIPIDTSSVKSDDCTFKVPQSPPKKTRIAANFAAPYQMTWNY